MAPRIWKAIASYFRAMLGMSTRRSGARSWRELSIIVACASDGRTPLWFLGTRSDRRRTARCRAECRLCLDQLRDHANHRRMCFHGSGAHHFDSELVANCACFRIQIVKNFHMIGEKTDGAISASV